MLFKAFIKLFVPYQSPVSFSEKLVSGVAGLLGIGLVMLVSHIYLDSEALPWIVASIGAIDA